jgi:hypothetical protein
MEFGVIDGCMACIVANWTAVDWRKWPLLPALFVAMREKKRETDHSRFGATMPARWRWRWCWC